MLRISNQFSVFFQQKNKTDFSQLHTRAHALFIPRCFLLSLSRSDAKHTDCLMLLLEDTTDSKNLFWQFLVVAFCSMCFVFSIYLFSSLLCDITHTYIDSFSLALWEKRNIMIWIEQWRCVMFTYNVVFVANPYTNEVEIERERERATT